MIIFERLRSLPVWQRRIIYVFIGMLVILILGSAIWPMVNVGQMQNNQESQNPQTTGPESVLNVSPFLFGASLTVTDLNDPIFTNSLFRTTVQSLHIQVVRVSLPLQTSDEVVGKLAQLLQDMNVTPFFSLEGISDPQFQDHTRHLLDILPKTLAQKRILYEIGNEEDLRGLSADKYVEIWNNMVPGFRSLAPTAHFIGPVTSHLDTNYLRVFLQKASPLPDEVSWHAYSCLAADTTDQCLAGLDNWKTQISDARQLMVNVLSKTLPIVISEWSYAPGITSDDAKSKNDQFLSAWVSKALLTLAQQQIFVAVYNGINTQASLINQTQAVTASGSIFQKQYEVWIPQATPTGIASISTNTPVATNTATATPTATSPQPTPTPTQNQPTPTPTPKPPAPGSPGYNDYVFQQGTGGTTVYSSSLAAQDGYQWTTGDSGSGVCQFANKAFQETQRTSGYLITCAATQTNIADFAFQVNMSITAGSGSDGGGIAFRLVGGRYLRFRLGVSGNYDLVDEINTLTSGSSNAIKTGLKANNQVTVIAKGERIWIFVNGALVTQYTHKNSPSGGQLGVFAVSWDKPTTVLYTNAKIWDLRNQQI